MENNTLALVLKNDWVTSSSGNAYAGQYTVGRFHLTDAFIVEYMKLIHGIEIPDSWVSSSFTNISDTDTRKVMYMEGCDMLSKDGMNEIRKAVKSPPDNVKIYRNDVHIVKAEIMEKKNGLTF
ncbi:Uncharacterised protein [Enterobacter hormaechei]|uniref:hypothetical protein n=1 Tax=Enterobacteriaceae TaxID=543 RepID=UPI0007949E1A|nr:MULTISPECIES: hypothetical protein [Enterobacteriaceae]MDE8799950.1 hypothetical protein [Citrobacter freundii]MDE8805067.1 hypothetical protein [Citrobacter freundii]SAB43065.1 Uncharacterised protein [Enterobacter hormaechei]